MTDRSMTARYIAVYQVMAGTALLAAGVLTRGWWAGVVGALLLAAGLAAAFGKGEATSWFRGELDERRQQAVDRSFRVAFLVLAWWVAGLTAVAASWSVPLSLWAAGIVVALIAAYANYAITLRRT